MFYLTLPPSADQFELEYLGWRVVEGDVLYRDLIDQNWPGIVWLHALSAGIFGNHLWSWRALDFIFVILAAGFLADLLRRSSGIAAARYALVLYPLFYAGLSEWVAGQTDMSAAHFLPAVLWFHQRAHARSDWRWQLAAGAFLGASMLVKPTNGLLGALLVLQGLLLRVPFRRAAGHAVAAAASAVAVLLAGYGLLRLSGASARDIAESVWTYNRETQYAWGISNGVLLVRLFSMASWWVGLTVLGVPGLVWALRKENGSIGTTAPAALWITGLVSYWVQRKAVGYHLSAAFPSALAFIPLGLASLGRSRALAAALLVPLALVGWRWGRNYNSSFQPRHYERYFEEEGLTIREALDLAARMEREIPKNETALVFSRASSMNYLSRRRQPTRFYYAPVLLNAVPPLSMADRWCDQFEQDLRQSVPRWCMIPTDYDAWFRGDSRAAATLRALLANGYRREGIHGRDPGLILYIREAP